MNENQDITPMKQNEVQQFVADFAEVMSPLTEQETILIQQMMLDSLKRENDTLTAFLREIATTNLNGKATPREVEWQQKARKLLGME